jgi:hypothetical protein
MHKLDLNTSFAFLGQRYVPFYFILLLYFLFLGIDLASSLLLDRLSVVRIETDLASSRLRIRLSVVPPFVFEPALVSKHFSSGLQLVVFASQDWARQPYHSIVLFDRN